MLTFTARAVRLWLLAGAGLRQTNRCCSQMRGGTVNVLSEAGAHESASLPSDQKTAKLYSQSPSQSPECPGGGPGQGRFPTLGQ